MTVLILIFNVGLLLVGCVTEKQVKNEKNDLTVLYTKEPIVLDGLLNEAVWKKTISYNLTLSKDEKRKKIQEPGQVQLAWDNDFLYVAANFKDSDIVATNKHDEQLHFKYGDVCEVFLKPKNHTWYWELYSTPAGNKTNLFFPGTGYFGMSCVKDHSTGMEVASSLDGTLNDWQDKDSSWTTEMAIPIKGLTLNDSIKFLDTEWYILIARYNYARYLEGIGPELSMYPRLSESLFHLTDEYSKISLIKE